MLMTLAWTEWTLSRLHFVVLVLLYIEYFIGKDFSKKI